jgi:hypothetical protein
LELLLVVGAFWERAKIPMVLKVRRVLKILNLLELQQLQQLLDHS